MIYMKFWNVLTQKTIALVLATFIFSLPLTSIAAAKDRHDAPPPPRQEERHDRPERKDPPKPPKEEPRHDRDDRRHDAPPPPRDREDHDKDDNGNAVTGFIIGAAVGAIVAKNT